ncbi:MAG: hypothetical protein E7588_10085 [Ruminococcaceae bacterium]|nr:hypothetical protein [Oscillospiraceae bacterium]
MKKAFVILLMLALMLIIPAHAKVGDVNGVALHTSIVAYINNYAIPSYAVNGQSCIVAEDLANFGFNVYWDGTTMTLSITRANTAHVNEMSFKKEGESGSKFADTLETEVKVFANDQKLTSYAINGFTMIPMEELTMFGNVQWVPDEAALKMWVDGLNTRSEKQGITKFYKAKFSHSTEKSKTLFIEFIQLAIKNTTSAIKSMTSYIKTQNKTYVNYVFDYISLSREACNQAYNLCIDYADMHSALPYFEEIFKEFDFFKSGNVTINNFSEHIGRINNLYKDLADEYKAWYFSN